MNHLIPNQAATTEDSIALVRNIVYVALVPFAAWATFYAIAIVSKTPVAGTALAVTDASFVVSMLVAATLGWLSLRWTQQSARRH